MRYAFAAVALLAAACHTQKVNPNGCNQDSDCGMPATAFRCEVSTGECYCRTDDACPPAQFCNPAGFCQDRAGCVDTGDCMDPSLFCDTSTGTCLPVGRCTSDLHCAQGQICDFTRSTCVAGCRSDGDCPGDACRCGDVACNCTGTTPDELKTCTVGVCDPNFCSTNAFCQFGQICGIPPDAGFTRSVCYSDFNADTRPYCATCSSGGGTLTCGSGANYCIIDTQTDATYCGADCSQGQACPNGYGCRDIRVVLTRWECDANNPCKGDTTLPCSADTDCARGGVCLKTDGMITGFCSGQCRLKEGANFGYCSCQTNADCVQQSCSMGECTISRRNCVNDIDCDEIQCVDFNGVGGCLIGQNCTPANGLTCVQVGGT